MIDVGEMETHERSGFGLVVEMLIRNCGIDIDVDSIHDEFQMMEQDQATALFSDTLELYRTHNKIAELAHDKCQLARLIASNFTDEGDFHIITFDGNEMTSTTGGIDVLYSTIKGAVGE